MGGVVSVIIKEKNKTHKMARWTNSLPYFVKHEGFFDKDPQHLKDYLLHWEEMLEDYNKNKATKKFQFPMTSVYVPEGGVIAPREYGIVYIDLEKNLLLSCQGYTTLNQIHLTGVLNDYQQTLDGSKDSKENFENFLKLRPRFKKIITHSKKDKGSFDYIMHSKNLEEDFKILLKQKLDVGFYSSLIEIDTSPFTFKIFPDDEQGFKNIYKEIKKENNLSLEEETIWQEYLERFKE